ncbi:uncharacterized protein EI90DRAFT_3116904 [Cantharellus anzutake]|uniref:uncharacterized protein n=1 Tax=Cantharellus anzutake TaxID=1750568 RepID=UPI0019087930|nr:uncharacterized protein EI90DRAFT_3116904 [Cantharellus anzutake]KAF8340354.1 hypothetical protein EI90DRAFT_3116904 [Cantharellus anzutake]
MSGSYHHPFPPVLPSFSQTFPDRSRTRGQSFSTPRRTERDHSHSSASLSAFNGSVQEPGRGTFVLPPLRAAGALPSSGLPGVHSSGENRQYSQSVPATRATSPTQVGRKRSHEMAIRHESSADEGVRQEIPLQSQGGWEVTAEVDRHKDRSKPRAPKSRAPLANVDEQDLADAEDDEDERRKTHRAIIRVKVEDRDDPTGRAADFSVVSGQSYRSRHSSSPSGASLRRMSTSTTSTSLTPYDVPSPLRVPSESSGETAPFNANLNPLNLSVLSSSTATSGIPKKRRVTVSGASIPSSTRSMYGQMSAAVSPISPAVIGFSVPKTPEAVNQLRNALSLKHQQKALIEARRFSQSVGATPEPSIVGTASTSKAKRGRPPKRSESQVSGTAASPVSPLGSSDFAGTTASFTSFTTNLDTNSRASSPGSACNMEHERRHPTSSTPIISPSTMEAALDVEMELETDSTPLFMRRRPEGDNGNPSRSEEAAGGTIHSEQQPPSRKGRSNPKLTLRTDTGQWPSMEKSGPHIAWSQSTEALSRENTSLRSAPPTSTPNHLQFRDVEAYQPPGASSGVGFSSHSSPTERSSVSAGTQRRPTLSSPHFHRQSDAHLHVPRPQNASYDDASGMQQQSHGPRPVPPSRTSSFHSQASSEHLPASDRSPSFVQLERRHPFSQSHGQQTTPLDSTATATTFARPPSQLSMGPRQHGHLAPLPDTALSSSRNGGGAAGTDDLISKITFMSLFEGVYDSMVDARRIRAWIDDQQKHQASASPLDDRSGYVREQDVARIIEEKLQTVREEARHEIDFLTGRIRELELRLEAMALDIPFLDDDGKTPKRRSPTILMDYDRDKTPAPTDRHTVQK